jgi:hypothetical protein
MIELFEVEDGIVKPTKHCYTIKWLKDLMDEFKKNDRYLGVYTYIFYMSCPNPKLNPFWNHPEEEREDAILESIELKVSTENSKVQAALDKAREMYETPTLRAYMGIKKALDNMADFMGNTTITGGKDGNVAQIRQVAKDFDSIRQSFKGVAKDLEEEQNNISTRGGGDLAYDQQ